MSAKLICWVLIADRFSNEETSFRMTLVDLINVMMQNCFVEPSQALAKYPAPRLPGVGSCRFGGGQCIAPLPSGHGDSSRTAAGVDDVELYQIVRTKPELAIHATAFLKVAAMDKDFDAAVFRAKDEAVALLLVEKFHPASGALHAVLLTATDSAWRRLANGPAASSPQPSANIPSSRSTTMKWFAIWALSH
jgi:hypothetical protein